MILNSLSPAITLGVNRGIANALYAGSIPITARSYYVGSVPRSASDGPSPAGGGTQYSDMNKDEVVADFTNAAAARDAFGFGLPSTPEGRAIAAMNLATSAFTPFFGPMVNVAEWAGQPGRIDNLLSKSPEDLVSIYDALPDRAKALADEGIADNAGIANSQYGWGGWDAPSAQGMIGDYGWGGWDNDGGGGGASGGGGVGSSPSNSGHGDDPAGF